MEYKFKGTLTLNKDYDVSFQLSDGILRFNLLSKTSFLQNKRHFLLEGLTECGNSIYILVDYFYKLGPGNFEDDEKEKNKFVGLHGVVEACVVLVSGTVSDIDSVGFYSLAIPRITGYTISGYLNDVNSFWTGFKNTLGKFILNNWEYNLSIGFVENEPCYSGQLLELKTERKFDIISLKDTYWVIKNFFAFLFQKTHVPIDSIYLRTNGKNIGQLFVDYLEKDSTVFLGIKCIKINTLKRNVDNLLQLLADNKIYLRHIPMFKDEEKLYTPGRFLMALVGLENTLDLMNVHVIHDDRHIFAINNARNKIMELSNQSTGDEKKIYKRILNQLQKNENFESRILVSLNEDKDYIVNFFPLDILGDTPNIAKDLSDARNDLAHGDLNVDLGLKATYQMYFLILYILYLQLKMIGFDKKEASEIVPQILFRH